MSMKRITKILIFSIIAIMALPVYAYDFYSDGFYYQILSKTNKTVAVTYKTDKYSGIVCDDYSGDIVIPNITTYDGNTYSVTAISDNAFWGCQKIKTLIIGDSVKTIGRLAFEDCHLMTKARLGISVTFINSYAFENCVSLVSISIPNTVGYIGPYSFNNDVALDSIFCHVKNPLYIASNVFDNVNKSRCILFVPSCSRDTYLSAFAWKKFTIIQSLGDFEAVDLGISVRWSNWNLGAISPVDYGGLYGWADTTGEKVSTNPDDYPIKNPPLNISGTEYDIAYRKTGGEWRMPSLREMHELRDKCTCFYSELYGINGLMVIGPNGNSIFLPAAGERHGKTITNIGTDGNYWTGASGKNYGRSYSFYNTDKLNWDNYLDRYIGLSVRPVYVEILNGVNDVNDGSLNVFALQGELLIKGASDGALVNVYDSCGRNVYSGYDKVINLSNGFYIVKIGSFSKKVVIR